MSLTDSNKNKNYSNINNTNKNKVIRDRSHKNIGVAKIDKKSTVAEHFGKGGLLYKGKAKDYPGISNIIKKNKLKVIPINIKKNK